MFRSLKDALAKCLLSLFYTGCAHTCTRTLKSSSDGEMADKHEATGKYPGRNGNTPLSFQKMNAYNSERSRLRAIQGIHERGAWRNTLSVSFSPLLMSIDVSSNLRLTRLHNVLRCLRSTVALCLDDIGIVEYRIKIKVGHLRSI